jgi:hypothetical protein
MEIELKASFNIKLIYTDTDSDTIKNCLHPPEEGTWKMCLGLQNENTISLQLNAMVWKLKVFREGSQSLILLVIDQGYSNISFVGKN